MSDFPALSNFLAAYFHQDWQLEHGAPDAVADAFIASEADADIVQVRADLQRLSDRRLDETALVAQLDALGSEYAPHGDDTYAAFISALLTRFQRTS